MKKTDSTYSDEFKIVSGGGGIVHCADPYDLRPALDALQSEIERRTQGGRKLVVLMGECHEMPAHRALCQSLMGRLMSSSSAIACGIERPHNLLDMILKDNFQCRLPGLPSGAMGRADRDGQNLLKAYLAVGMVYGSGAIDRNFMKFCLDAGVSMRANDVAKKIVNMPVRYSDESENVCCLDDADPITRSLIDAGGDVLRGMNNISTMSTEGMYLRNCLMAGQARDHMQSSGAQVYILNCGNAHLYGNNESYGGCIDTTPFHQSLSALFNEAGMDVLPVFTAYGQYSIESIPDEAWDLRQQGMLIDGLSKRCPENFDLPDDDGFEAMALLHKISASSSGEFKVMPEHAGEDDVLLSEVQSLIPSWIDEARERLKKPPVPAHKPS